MKFKPFTAALTVAVLLGAGLAANSANAIGPRPGRVISSPGDPVGPQTGAWRGSYYKDQTVSSDGIEHTGEVITTLRSVYYVYGATYQDCHNALIAEASAAYANNWTDCSLQ